MMSLDCATHVDQTCDRKALQKHLQNGDNDSVQFLMNDCHEHM